MTPAKRYLQAGLTAVAMMMITGAASAAPVLATPEQEAAVIAQCQAWFKDGTFKAPTLTKNLDGGLCFTGEIHAGDDTAFLEALALHPADQPLVVVARSGGGDLTTALNMAEPLLNRPVTMVADQLCGSACANYLMAAGRRRVVLPRTLLLYHGGATFDFLDDMATDARRQIDAMAHNDPAMAPGSEAMANQAIADMLHNMTALVARQDAFLEKAGVSRTFFRWMNLFNHMNAEEQASHCATPPHMIVYPPALLARFGLKIDRYDGPVSQTEVDDIVGAMQVGKPMCYWQE